MIRIPGNDVVCAGLEGKVENPPVLQIGDARPIVPSRAVGLAHVGQDEGDVDCPPNACVVLDVGLAHGVYQLVHIVVADRGPDAAGGDLVDDAVVGGIRSAHRGGRNHVRVEDDQHRYQAGLGISFRGFASPAVLSPLSDLIGRWRRETPLIPRIEVLGILFPGFLDRSPR